MYPKQPLRGAVKLEQNLVNQTEHKTQANKSTYKLKQIHRHIRIHTHIYTYVPIKP